MFNFPLKNLFGFNDASVTATAKNTQIKKQERPKPSVTTADTTESTTTPEVPIEKESTAEGLPTEALAEVDAQPKSEAKEEVEPVDPLVTHWNEIWNATGEGVIDLNTKKAKWPNEIKSRIKEANITSFLDKCANGTGYYDDLKSKDLGVKPGTILKGTSGNGRRVVIITGSNAGNLVVFERYSDTTVPLVAHLPEVVKTLLGHDTSALTDYELRIFFGSYNFPKNNVMTRLVGLVDL